MVDKKTAFDKATDGQPGEAPDPEAETRHSPRAVFTKNTTLDLSKLQIGSLRIAQGMTQEVKDRKASIGQFLLANFPAADEVVLVPFGAQDIRVYRPDPKKAPLCNAPTGDVGFGNPGGLCADCSLKDWGDYNELTGKSVPPLCKEGLMLRAYSITHRSLIDMQFMAGDRGKCAFIQGQAVSFGWSNFCIKLTSADKSNNKGSWFVPQVEMMPEVPQEHVEIVGKWFEVFNAGLSESKESALQQLAAGLS